MKQKLLLSFILSVMTFGIVSADGSIPGIIATYDSAEVSYMLADMPIVQYVEAGGVTNANLYISGLPTAVASFALTGGKKLVITYGEYVSVSTGTEDKVTITERNGKKIIQGGQLIIISKDGKKYDTAGILVK